MKQDTVTQRRKKKQRIDQLKALIDWYKPERWIESFNPKQLEAAEAFLSGDYKVVAMIGANQSGKTIACLATFCQFLRDDAPAGAVYWCIAPNQEKSIQRQQKELWEMLPRTLFGDQHFEEKNGFGSVRPMVVIDPDRIINGKHHVGRKINIWFKSAAQYDSDHRAFESVPIDGVWVDESIQQAHYDALLPRTVAKDAWFLFSCIPDVPWMHQQFQNAKPDAKVKFIKLCIRDNEKNLAPGAIETLRANMSPDDAAMRLDGDFRFLEGLIFKEFQKEYYVSPTKGGHLIKRNFVPDDVKWFNCMDIGMDHPTVSLLCAVDRKNRLYVVDEYAARHAAVSNDVTAIKAMINKRELEWPTVIDPSAYFVTKGNPNGTAAKYEELGLPLTPGVRFTHGKEWYVIQDMIEGFIRRDILICENCTHLIHNLTSWMYKRDLHNRSMARDSFEDRNNDAIDALKYLWSLGPVYRTQRAEVAYEEEYA